ncbi:MAG: AAA family ATPase, partial [Actinomycetota bacterium]|nr:AAA family ATPase [Actinomycetota bacterium]
MTVLVVTGTSTGVGKTVVTAAIAALAVTSGCRVAVVKATQTGVRVGQPGDVEEIQRLVGLPIT